MTTSYRPVAPLDPARFIDFWNGPGSFAVYAPETREKVIARMPLILANFAALSQETWPLADCGRVACPTLGVYGELFTWRPQ